VNWKSTSGSRVDIDGLHKHWISTSGEMHSWHSFCISTGGQHRNVKDTNQISASGSHFKACVFCFILRMTTSVNFEQYWMLTSGMFFITFFLTKGPYLVFNQVIYFFNHFQCIMNIKEAKEW